MIKATFVNKPSRGNWPTLCPEACETLTTLDKQLDDGILNRQIDTLQLCKSDPAMHSFLTVMCYV